MKPQWVILTGLLTLGIAGAAFLFCWRDSAQPALEETRRALRQQGFKIDLTEFDFSASPEQRARAAALTDADLRPGSWTGSEADRRAQLPQQQPDLMAATGPNAAIVIWKQEKLVYSGGDVYLEKILAGEDVWKALRSTFDGNRLALDAACKAALSGPIRFDLDANHGGNMLLRHLPVLKKLTRVFGTRAVLDLHDGNKDAAWTNLLASTRVVTAWDPEPTEISHLVRYDCAATAYRVTWQALQAGGWPDERLALLQHEWESVDFFKGLPDTEAFARASDTASCQRERQEPAPPSRLLSGLRQSPKNAGYGIMERWRRILFRNHGSYEDEKALLLYHRDRELQLRRAVQAPTWLEVRQLPASINSAPFQSKNHSRVLMQLNLRQTSMAFARQGQGMLGRAAEAEARRRLITTAVALERYHGRHGAYPQMLQALVPELLQRPPMDFMDGQPLRYHLTEDGQFVLYSVGLDCVDNGGEMRRPRSQRPGYPPGLPEFGIPEGTDLVWPRAASAAEVQAHRREQESQAKLQKAALEERLAEGERQAEAARQATIENLVAEAAAAKAVPPSSRKAGNEPSYQGRPLSQLLRNDKIAGTAAATLDELLTLKQITTGEETDIATFELPIRYDIVTNIGSLRLLVDAGPEGQGSRAGGEVQGCGRATNGSCLLVWNTTYDPPGQHVLRAQLLYTERQRGWRSLEIKGPLTPFFSSNLCQFDPFYSQFDSRGAILYAKLPESNGLYTIELNMPAGAHIRTFTGSTSNGVIKVHWDLKDDHGLRCTNDTVDSVFHVTLPGSGRSQTLKGP